MTQCRKHLTINDGFRSSLFSANGSALAQVGIWGPYYPRPPILALLSFAVSFFVRLLLPYCWRRCHHWKNPSPFSSFTTVLLAPGRRLPLTSTVAVGGIFRAAIVTPGTNTHAVADAMNTKGYAGPSSRWESLPGPNGDYRIESRSTYEHRSQIPLCANVWLRSIWDLECPGSRNNETFRNSKLQANET